MMGETLMKEEQLEAIGDYVKKHIADWIKDSNIIPFSTGSAGYTTEVRGFDFSLTERIVRVEESLKHQGEILEKILHQFDKRFEQVDKRFEQVDKRFEQVDKRFEQVDKRFEQVDRRFEELRSDMNMRFAHMEKRFGQMFIYLTTIFIVIGTLVSVFGFMK